MGFESSNASENLTTVNEGESDRRIEKMRQQIDSLAAMVDQIAILQKVPYDYKNLGAPDSQESFTPDLLAKYQAAYEERQEYAVASLSAAHEDIRIQLSLLRHRTGVSTEAEEKVRNFETRIQEMLHTLIHQGYSPAIGIEFTDLFKAMPDGVSKDTRRNLDIVLAFLTPPTSANLTSKFDKNDQNT